MKIDHPFAVLAFILCLLLSANRQVAALQLQTLAESETGLELIISDDSEFQHYQSEGENYLFLGNASLDWISDALSVPVWNFNLALPSPDPPLLEIRMIETETLPLANPINLKDVEIVNNRKQIEITNLGFLRYTPSGDLRIHPLRIDLQSETVRIIRKLHIVLSYKKSSRDDSTPNQRIKPEKHIANAFINPKYIAQWQRYPVPRLAKRVAAPPAGKWFRLTVNENGIYAVSLTDLQDQGLTETDIDINRIYLFSNSTNGHELDATIGAEVPENLVENARQIEDNNNDGKFDSGDRILFWGRSSSSSTTDKDGELYFHRNAYSLYNYYWLLIADNSGSPRQIISQESIQSLLDYRLHRFEKIDHHEKEADNFLRSGKFWYGEKFKNSGSSISVIFTIPTPLPGDPDSYDIRVNLITRGKTNEATHRYKLYINNNANPSLQWSNDDFYYSKKSLDVSLDSGMHFFRIQYTSSVAAGEAYLDYIQLIYQAPLAPRGNSLEFWGPKESGIVEYELSEVNLSDPLIYDLTDWRHVKLQDYSKQGDNSITFRQTNEKEQRSHFYITNKEQFKSVAGFEKIDNPNWNSLRNPENKAEYIIITTPEFQEAATELARVHSSEVKADDRLSTRVVFQDQIMREFNADIRDPHAIRFFLKYAFDNWQTPPEYVLLLGDGTFDYRHIESGEGEIIMTYQVQPATQSMGGFSSYASDCRFAYIHGNDQKMDLAVGRINARTPEEARLAVAKIRQYLAEPIYGDWRSHITLVADDPERPRKREEYHINDSENYIARYIPAVIDLKKIYLLEYPEVKDATTYGVKKPAATEDLLNQIEKGTTIINYFGHGSPTVWTQEHTLVMDRDLGKINTGMKLPLWIGATCSWGQFDDISGSCMPEALILQPEDGGIAAIGASRATYPGSNRTFVSYFIRLLFANGNAQRIRLGTLLQYVSAAGSGETANSEKYLLFGDPALYLALPYETVAFNQLANDTLKTLSNIAVSGQLDSDRDFNGNGILKVFDSERYVTRNYQSWNSIKKIWETHSVSYLLPGEIIFKGKIQFDNSTFATKFFIPKDLNYEDRKGKITLYAWASEAAIEASGAHSSIVYAGSATVSDTTGPRITIGFEDMHHQDGDIVTPEAVFEIAISDPLGINIARKMGHEITLLLDDDPDQTYQITEYFAYDTNSDTSGTIRYPIPEFASGIHSATVTAWDNSNNANQETVTFTYSPSLDFQLHRVVNYPNPFPQETDITFEITHPAEVEISIYTLRGLKIRTLESSMIYSAGFNSVHWDGHDDFGDAIARGIYIYKTTAKSIDTGKQKTYIGKMVKVK